MVPVFKNVGLIGLGLIGGSLARVIKKNNLAQKVIGYTKSEDSIKTALTLGIIDEALPLNKLAANCDIIIICTPLSTYENIFKEIAPFLKADIIISDAGSLKAFTLELAGKYLAENRNNFVPAHPIAGTEKTGVEAGFAELYNGKKVIITPDENTSASAIERIKLLWQSCGSNAQIMEAQQHDKIYAEVSHLPQFLAYCYASMLKDTITEKFTTTDEFLKFSRICSSEPVIWLDIFSMNKDNILLCLNNFTNTLQAKLIGDNAESNYIYTTFPAVISKILIECSPNASYAGSGFKDFISYNLNNISYNIDTISNFIAKINELAGYLKNNQSEEALRFMQEASNWYRSFKNSSN